ncbi:HEAT repeat domain-containing protein [Pseudoalteromonas sp. NBT06-2]|uniref:HEAT repeat domain-containing protein n=1 Tax=Pseudoalteromonas sp. NBT06-2 TaxID=2025950 RepID=UPI0011409D61|nr:HEAT repeat domain-containing protein [Pseudoalteromonas sp. NBT06-2]
MDLLKLEQVLLDQSTNNDDVENIERIFNDFLEGINIPQLLTNYLEVFGSLDPSKNEKFISEKAKKATITPISIIFFENEYYKFSIRELHRSDKVIASDSIYFLKALSDLTIDIFDFNLEKLLFENWEQNIEHKNKVCLKQFENTTVLKNKAFYYSGEKVKLILVLERKPLGPTRSVYNSSTFKLEQIASNFIESDRRNEALKAIINILDNSNKCLPNSYKALLEKLLDDKYFSIRWNAARLLINNFEGIDDERTFQKLLSDRNNFIRKNIAEFLGEAVHV